MIAPDPAAPSVAALRRPTTFPSWEEMAATCILGAALRFPDFVANCRTDLAGLAAPSDLEPLKSAVLAAVPRRRLVWPGHEMTTAELRARLTDLGVGSVAEAVIARTANFPWLADSAPDDLVVGAIGLLLASLRGEGEPLPETFATITRASQRPWKATPASRWSRIFSLVGKAGDLVSRTAKGSQS